MALAVIRFAIGLTAAFLLGSQSSPVAAQPDTVLAGHGVTVKPGRFVKVVVRGSALLPTANDPTLLGATLRVFDTAPGAGENAYALPASGWRGLGIPPGSAGFVYRGTGLTTDPCRMVRVTGKLIKAVCGGSAVSLAPPFAGDVGVELAVGDGAQRHCASFGGTTVRNTAELTKRHSAPAPAACPTAQPTGTQVCALAPARSTIAYSTLLTFPAWHLPSGALRITCGTTDGSGSAPCTCELLHAGVIHIPEIADVCITPSAGCPGGQIDCSGGAPLDTALVAEHDVGPCGDETTCDAACTADCSAAGSGYARLDSSCEGFCQAGSNDGLACTNISQCPGGHCAGGNAAPLHAGRCNCICGASGQGGPSAAGTLSCNVGLQVRWELPADGDCLDGPPPSGTPFDSGPICLPLTSATATGVLTEANNTATSIPASGVSSESGTGVSCTDFAFGQLTGLQLVGVNVAFDPAIGDSLVRVAFGCQ